MHVFDVRTGTWSKITPLGEPPSPRAAHAAAAVGAMVVVQVGLISDEALLCKRFHMQQTVCLEEAKPPDSFVLRALLCIALQGGIGPAGLASEDLHVLDFTDMDRPRWHRYGLALQSSSELCSRGSGWV